MLKKLISKRINFENSVQNWEEAIILSATPLLQEKFILQSYIDHMISGIKNFGPYIILCDGIAMPHSRPEDGALKTGMSFLKLNQGVVFPDTDIPISIFFCLAASDPNSHIDAMTELADLLSNEQQVQQLFQIQTHEDLMKFIL